MKKEKINKPYTYAIGWSKLGIWYYGVRFSRKSYVGDIWEKYFTSSVIVKKFVRNNGNPDIIKVTKVFDSIEKACEHETNFLQKVKVNTNPKLLNAHYTPAFPLKSFSENSMHFPKVKEKMILTKRKIGLVNFVRNKKFKPSKNITIIKRILLYIDIVKMYKRDKNRIMSLLLSRLLDCENYSRKLYPKNRKSYPRGKNCKISKSKIGKKAYYDPITKKCRMFNEKDDIPCGWLKGLIKNTPNNNTPETIEKISKKMKTIRALETKEQKKKRVEKFKITVSLKKKDLYNDLQYK